MVRIVPDAEPRCLACGSTAVYCTYSVSLATYAGTGAYECLVCLETWTGAVHAENEFDELLAEARAAAEEMNDE